MTKEEVLSILKTHPNGNIENPQFKKKFPELYQEVMSWSFPDDFKFTQKLYHYFNDDPNLKLGLCPVCGKRCKFQKFNSGYSKHCSPSCSTKNEETLNKMKHTCLEKYGVDNYAKSKECQSKMSQTCLEKYGVKNYSQSDEFKDKLKNICLSKYGVENPFQFKGFIEKIKKTNLEKYGFEYYMQTDEYKRRSKETCLVKYGVENYSQTIECRNKVKQSFKKKYGVENYSQTNEFAKFHKKSIKYDDLMFDSSWEVMVYKYCQEQNIPCEYQPDIRFEYMWKDKKHIYQPDFLIDGKLYEVKGEHFFDGDKMICPYDRSLDELYESKHQCMIDNGVILLRKVDIIDNSLDILGFHKYLI